MIISIRFNVFNQLNNFVFKSKHLYLLPILPGLLKTISFLTNIHSRHGLSERTSLFPIPILHVAFMTAILPILISVWGKYSLTILASNLIIRPPITFVNVTAPPLAPASNWAKLFLLLPGNLRYFLTTPLTFHWLFMLYGLPCQTISLRIENLLFSHPVVNQNSITVFARAFRVRISLWIRTSPVAALAIFFNQNMLFFIIPSITKIIYLLITLMRGRCQIIKFPAETRNITI